MKMNFAPLIFVLSSILPFFAIAEDGKPIAGWLRGVPQRSAIEVSAFEKVEITEQIVGKIPATTAHPAFESREVQATVTVSILPKYCNSFFARHPIVGFFQEAQLSSEEDKVASIQFLDLIKASDINSGNPCGAVAPVKISFDLALGFKNVNPENGEVLGSSLRTKTFRLDFGESSSSPIHGLFLKYSAEKNQITAEVLTQN